MLLNNVKSDADGFLGNSITCNCDFGCTDDDDYVDDNDDDDDDHEDDGDYRNSNNWKFKILVLLL